MDSIKFLSYNEARLAGMFGMKILDPLAIKEIDNNNMDIPIVITNLNDPSNTTTISKISADQSDNLIKIVTGKRNCTMLHLLICRQISCVRQFGRQGELWLLSQ